MILMIFIFFFCTIRDFFVNFRPLLLIFQFRVKRNNFDSYKPNSRRLDFLNQIANQETLPNEKEDANNQQVFLASLKQSKYNNRPVSSKMESKPKRRKIKSPLSFFLVLFCFYISKPISGHFLTFY